MELLTGEHMVAKHAGQTHDPLVAIVRQVGDDHCGEGFSRLDKRAAQVVLVLLHLQSVLCDCGERGEREKCGLITH